MGNYYYGSKTNKNDVFVKNYKKQFGKNPTSDVALAYDMGKIITERLKTASDFDRKNIYKLFNNFKYDSAVTGYYHYGSGGHPEKPYFLIEITNNKVNLLKVIK